MAQLLHRLLCKKEEIMFKVIFFSPPRDLISDNYATEVNIFQTYPDSLLGHLGLLWLKTYIRCVPVW